MAPVLIAVVTCERFRERADACRKTWAKRVPELFDVRFFLGAGAPQQHDDEVLLESGDNYLSLPAKVKETCLWSRTNGYVYTYKVDDDSFLIGERLAAAYERVHRLRDYVGNFRESFVHPRGYASGFCYGLSRKSAEVIADSDVTNDPNEDRWVGTMLHKYADAGLGTINMYDEKRFVVCDLSRPVSIFSAQSNLGKSHIAFAEYNAEEMHDCDKWYRRSNGILW